MSIATERQTIHIPPDAAHVASVRAFVGAIGRHAGCADEVIEDLRLAATEACAQALGEGAAPDGIEVRAWLGDRALRLEIEPTGSFARVPEGLDAISGTATRRLLIEGLFPDAEFDQSGDAGVLRVSVPVSPP